jgi:Na+/H+ antiporter NhaD/arsenite permease-like protein
MHPGGLENHFSHASNSHQGWDTINAVFSNAILVEFVPFIVLLFSLYTISGGINLRGDLPARPEVNCAFLTMGALLASFIGTTGAAMLLIRPLLSTNAERRYKVHTVVLFIFVVCNCGGLLLPIGDPPLFLGYLRGVPFNWTLRLWPYWLTVNLALLAIYYVWDRIAYTREPIRAIVRDEAEIRPLKLSGKKNVLFILGVVLAVAFVVPGNPFPGTHTETPPFFREMLMLIFVLASLLLTRPEVRFWNRFDYHAIVEVAALFSGIFLCMQVPVEILNSQGSSLGINSAGAFFWATGILSSFLDNAPTYVVFFETAVGMSSGTMGPVIELIRGSVILEEYLVPISLGAVFMGANTYIGNGPNFMVKSIAEQSGVKMPSFFGYMLYSLLILTPLFVVITIIL